MTPVTIAGMVAGALLLLTALRTFWITKAFSGGGITATVIALLFIGMSQWTTIRFKGGGVEIDLSRLREQIAATAQAVDEVAAEATRTAGAAEATREQVLALAEHLGSRQAIAPATLANVRRSLAALQLDTTRLHSTRDSLRRVVPR